LRFVVRGEPGHRRGVVMFISFRVIAQIVVINSLIDEILLSDNLPVSQVLHGKCHVLTEHQLSWCLV